MPFDPISATVAGAGLIFDFLKNQQAQASAAQNQAYQRENLARMMAQAEEGRAGAMRLAGSLRQDQFGNATYYDPTQGRWITYYTPTQQELIRGGEERQRRAQVRGAQASQDYDQQRAEYLYRRPKTEAESYAEIAHLLNQAQGTGERQLNTLMNRFGIRTAGNLPQLVQTDTGPTPGQQLAETMLKARQAALEEYGTREKIHQGRYLPAMKQFEETANYVAPVDPTGSGIVGMTQQGLKDMLSTGSDYDKLLATLGVSGARNVGAAYDTATKTAGGGPGASDFLSLAKMLMPGQDKTAGGTTGGTRGARASTSGEGGVRLDNRFNYGLWGKGLGDEELGGEAVPRGLLGENTMRFGTGGYDPNQRTVFDLTSADIFNQATSKTDPYTDYGSPYRAGSYDPSGSYALNPFGNLYQF